MHLLSNKHIKFIVLLLVIYSAIYFALKYLTGISTPGGTYNLFAAKYLNIASYTRNAIMYCVAGFVNLFGYNTFRESDYVLRVVNGTGIKLVYGCLAYGVMSFWIAYIIASSTIFKTKIQWLFLGLFILWIVNVIRICLVLVSTVHNWSFPFGIDQHSWFNIVAYLIIFVMIYFFEKSLKLKNEQS